MGDIGEFDFTYVRDEDGVLVQTTTATPGTENIITFVTDAPTVTPTDGCVDSTLIVANVGLGCADISDLSVCDDEPAKTHCPNTCGVCDEYGCVDSILKVEYDGNVGRCAELASLSQAMIDSLCDTEGVSSTCRATCGCA